MTTRNLLVTVLLLTLSSTAYSQTTPTRSGGSDQSHRHHRLAKGKAAPFSGVLLTDQALAKIISDYEGKIAALKLELEKERKDRQAEKQAADTICQAKVDGEKAKAKAAESGCQRERHVYEQALKRANETPWYQNNYLNFLLGSVVAGGICTGVSFAVNK